MYRQDVGVVRPRKWKDAKVISYSVPVYETGQMCGMGSVIIFIVIIVIRSPVFSCDAQHTRHGQTGRIWL